LSNMDVKQAIVRALTIPFATPAACRSLVDEFRCAPADAHAYRWAVGNALEVVGDDSVIEDMMSFAEDRKYGMARQMVVVGLGKSRDPRVVKVLTRLLDDEEVAGHSIMALGKLGATIARPRIEAFSHHEKAWLRKEAKKALDRIDRRSKG
jgi:HEAT repeats